MVQLLMACCSRTGLTAAFSLAPLSCEQAPTVGTSNLTRVHTAPSPSAFDCERKSIRKHMFRSAFEHFRPSEQQPHGQGSLRRPKLQGVPKVPHAAYCAYRGYMVPPADTMSVVADSNADPQDPVMYICKYGKHPAGASQQTLAAGRLSMYTAR